MTPGDLLAAFAAVAEAPDGVARLRELVLQLAVRGKLVPQDPADEPASVLLERIAAEKAQLVKAGSSRKRELLSAVSQFDVPLEVAVGWRWARFTDVARIASNLVDPADFRSEPHVAPDSIEKATGRLIGYRTIGEDGVASGKHKFSSGQILYSKIRPNLSKVVTVDFAGLCSADMYPIDPWIDRGYLHTFMLSQPFLDQITSDDNRLAMPKVNQEQLSAVHVPVPPLAEQHRIVARVDELMGLLDQLEAARSSRDATRAAVRDSALDALREADTPDEIQIAWNRLAERMDDLLCEPADIAPLRQTIFQLAVRGRLVPQDPTDEAANVLLERIAAERARLVKAGKIGAREPLPPVSETDAPFEVPSSWSWVRFGDTHINRDAERVPLSREHRSVRAGAFDYYGASGVIDHIDDFLFDRPLLLVGEDGANLVLRSTPIAFMARGKYWVNNHAHVLDSVDERSLVYLGIFINATDLKPFVTGTAQPKLNQARMNNIPCPLPPLAEQHRIVARVDELMRLLDRLEERLAAAQTAHVAFTAAAAHDLDA